MHPLHRCHSNTVSAPQPSSAARAREEENLQEAIRRSLQDNGQPNGGVRSVTENVRVAPSAPAAIGRSPQDNGYPTSGVGGVTEDIRVAPSAPDREDYEGLSESQKNGGSDAREDERSPDVGDIRRRRLQRLGVSSPPMSTDL